jgi:hypothetical protein
VELEFKLRRIEREQARNGQQTPGPTNKLSRRPRKPKKTSQPLTEADMKRLDREWEDYAAGTTGAALQRRWLQFLEENPGYTPKETRERVEALAKKLREMR